MIGTLIFTWLSNRKALNDATTETKLKLLQEANVEPRQIAEIAGTDNFLRKLSFFVLMLPFVLCAIEPNSVATYFKNLDVIPQWYKEIVIAVLAVVWGLPTVQNTLMQLLNVFRKK